MSHVAERVQASQHDDAAEHYLRQYTSHEPERQPHEPRLTRPHEERSQHGSDDTCGDHSREEAVQLLDGGMGRRDVDELLLIAGRPVDAAEPGAGEAHQRARHDDDVERDESDPDDDAVPPK